MRNSAVVLLVALGLAVICIAETWHLTGGQEWQKVEQQGDSAFLMAVSQAKQFVSTGDIGNAQKAFRKLKKNYPQIAGKDFDAFVKAEMLYGHRQYVKASQAYDRFTDQFPQSVFYQSVLERQYQIATAFLGGQKITALKVIRIKAYDEGGEIMNKIADKAGDAPVAQNALKTLARSKAKRGHYDAAYRTWSDVSNRWPTGRTGGEALLGMAESLEQSYNGPKFDSKVLESSKSYYDEYQKRYPEAADELEIAQKLEKIDEELAEKELIVADYYARTGRYTAANLYYQRVIDDWPDSTSASFVEQKMVNLKEKQQQEAERSQSKKKRLSLKEYFL